LVEASGAKKQRMHIYLCRDLKENLRDFWPKVKSWL